MNRTPVPDQFKEQEALATERQVSYLVALRDGKDLSKLTPAQRSWLINADFTKIPKKRASDIIEELTKLEWIPKDAGPKQPMPNNSAPLPEVKDGRYAVPKEDGTLMFYSVKKGKYTTFVDVWASDARWPVKNKSEKVRILKAILEDPDAGPRFGREIGRCYVCGRTLTDELSRELGIGPVCRGEG